MPIDWFTVVAQLINFLILVWLLKTFLYQPILRAIDEREQRIADRFAQAEKLQTTANEAREEFHRKNDQFDRERELLLKNARDEANSERLRLLEEARDSAISLKKNLEESWRHEQSNLLNKIHRWTCEEVFATARNVFAELVNCDVEGRMVELFIERLRELSDDAKSQIMTSLNVSQDTVRVRSAFELTAAQQNDLRRAFEETFERQAQFHFEIAPVLVAGIELTFDGRKLAWSVEDYIANLDSSVGRLFQDEWTATTGAVADVATASCETPVQRGVEPISSKAAAEP